MLSTYLQYEIYAKNLDKSLQRVGNEASVKTAKAYYDANIGKVKSVDDFIGNYRLFSYAMKAYGLEDMTYAKALMRKVLTSDLADSSSVANKMSDSRYLAFAKAFSFTTSGAVATPSVQSSDQQAATVTAFQSATASTLDATTVSDATSYYQSHIGSVSSVADLVKDKKLTSYVLTAYGIDASTPGANVAAILQSDLSDPTSLLNKTAGAGYLALNGAVNVDSSGAASVAETTAQSHDAALATATAYMASVGSDTAARTAAKAETTYFSTAISTITSADALLKDSRLVNYVVQAFGLPSNTSGETLKLALTSDPTDPTSFVNTVKDPAYKAVASAFNFDANGQLRTKPFQDSDQQNETVQLYTAHQTSDTAAVDAATSYYEAHIGSVHSVSDLEQDSQLYNYVLTAYGLSGAADTATVEHVMEDSPTDTTGVIGQTATAGYLALAQAFTVDGSGKARNALVAQSTDATSDTTTAYLAAAKNDGPSQQAAKAETTYFKDKIGTVTTVGALLGDDRMVAYLKQAYDLPTWLTTGQMRQMLTTGTGGGASLDATAKTLQAAFNFGTNGLLRPVAATGAQTAAQGAAIDTAYARQTMENEAGDQSTAVKLALYFQRTAPTITNAYSILADKALLQVFQTMLGIPASSGKQDIDVQARYLSSRINFADLKDPAKLNKMIQRFTAQYDLANPDTTQSSNIAMLFGSSST